MITPSLIYLINLADSIDGFLSFLAAVGILFTIILLWLAFKEHAEILDCDKKFYPERHEGNQKYIRNRNILIKYSIIPFSLSVLLIFFDCLLPSTKTCYEMLIIPKITNSQLTQKLPMYLQEYIEKELKGADK